jgi:hypothetical protein
VRRALKKLSQSDGFGLSEALVAMALLAMIMLTLASAINHGMSIQSQLGRTGISVYEASQIETSLRHLLERVWPDPRFLPDGVQARNFSGRSNGIQFISDLPTQFGKGGLYSIEVYGEKSRGMTDLHLKLFPVEGPPSPSQEPSVSTLLSQLSSITFAFGIPAVDGSIVWKSDWSDGSNRPTLVRLTMSRAEGDASVHRELIVAPLLHEAPL